MKFRILGPLCVVHGGATLALGGPRQRAVLATLLLHANSPVGVSTLCRSVWDEPPAAPESNLRTYVAGLRRRFRANESRSRLLTRDGRYLLCLEDGELDRDEFDTLVEYGEKAQDADDLQRAAGYFGRALALWRGQPLEDQVLGPALRAELTLLQERYLTVFEQYARVRIELGEARAVVGELRKELAAHPFREELCVLLMDALHRSGRRAEALAEFGRTRGRLVDQLGCEPGDRLADMHMRVLTANRPATPPRNAPASLADWWLRTRRWRTGFSLG